MTNKKKKIFIITAILLIAVLIGGALIFFLKQEKKTEEEKRQGFFEEELAHEETVYPEELLLPKERSLVKERGKTEIFWLQNKKRYLVISQQIIELMAEISNWDKIQEVSPGTLEDYLQGPDFIAPETRSDGLLISMKDTNYIFLMEQGKRKYLSQQEFQQRSYDSKNVIEVSTKIIKNLPPAPPVDHLSFQEAVKRGKIEIIGSGKYFEKGVVFIAGPYEENVAINIEKGDVLLSKKGKQSLIVTQDFEVFVPKNEKITLEGLWVACIDRFRPWPSAGEKLDVTLNLKDWKLKSASQLLDLLKIIDKKGVNKKQFAQDAIWRITDQQPINEEAKALLKEAGIDPEIKTTFLHLSNPSPLTKTSFVLPPELSLLGLVANYKENCPETKKANRIICQEEIEAAFRVYLEKKEFPGTVGQKIDSKILTLLISFYLSQKPIEETLTPVSQEEINNSAESLVKSLKQQGFKIPSFEIAEIKLIPKDVVEQENVTFSIEGEGIKDIKIKIFNLKGEKIFESEKTFGNLFEWHLRSNKDELLPNGFYSYQIEIKGFEEKEFLESAKRQLIIRL